METKNKAMEHSQPPSLLIPKVGVEIEPSMTLQLRLMQKAQEQNQQEGQIRQQETYTLPSPGMMRRVTVFPASLMRLTMSECDLLVMEHPFTAKIRSPTFSLPQRSAGLPSIIRPILWGMATHAFPAFVLVWGFLFCFGFGFLIDYICGWRGKGEKGLKREREG